ncbi:thiol reductant ABC exporter subunit CydC [Brevibacterium sp. UMB1308A]|uniref:thiol reductant ABC exporter subunit CydC n=1 Tax=Brevibacterium sp. UMB1308A TaxID=3050608 RepID=UPI00254D181B|nr:thiol reductant ABC exporter subunit CydC [Brevibacterium sp. UMB1308A]MDK8346416.1 thiol reductant ABC exporter subunit CydC [Brevibacterium sp. UMB1308B]MDK8713333.1 thiol reductant ABC exporter subunit CydC [Brevibacterium sp. UMB1308A]
MSKSPVAIALGAPQGARALAWLGLVAVLKAVGLVLIAESCARGIVALMHGEPFEFALLLGCVGATIRGVAVWLTKAVGARASVGFKTELRSRVLDRVTAGSGRDTGVSDGALAVSVTRTLDELDDYFVRVLPALLTTMCVPALIIVRILFADWVSAVVIVVTLPLVPLFMILIGKYTLERVSEATQSLDQLSNNLVELARGLPVLVGLGRVYAQTAALKSMSESYRTTTLQTLRVAFLSALALELIATLSVAVVAVFIGVRLVSGSLDLQAGLLALILAPECYLPLRQLGAAFHATENGMAAYERVKSVISRPVNAPVECRPGSLAIAEVSVTYAGRPRPALSPVSATFSGLTVVTGGSGTGKSTLLGVLAGLVRTNDTCTVSGHVVGVPERIAYAGQAPRTCGETLEEEAQLYGAELTPYLQRVGLDLDPHTPPSALSPGELRRFAIARALMRVDAGAKLLIVDEPTAHLDAQTAHTIRTELLNISQSIPVIAATHDPELINLGTELRLDGASSSTETTTTTTADTQPAHTPKAAPTSAPETQISTCTALRRLVNAMNVFSAKFIGSTLFAVAAVASAAALSGVSAWLIVHASFQPPIMYLLVAIVGVRFFGLSRSVFTYVKQLLLHDAMLTSLTQLRERVWLGFARAGTANRTLLRGELALTRLVADVDDVRDGAPRVVQPPIVAAVVAVAAIVVMALIHPWAAVLTAVCALVCVVCAPAVTLVVDGQASSARLSTRTQVLARISAFLWAREDVLVNGRAAEVVDSIRETDRQASHAELRVLWAAGIGEGIVTVATTLNAVLMLPLLASAVASGEVSPELLAVTVLLPLALIDCYIDSLTAVQNWPALKHSLARVPALDERGEIRKDTSEPVAEFDSAELEKVAARWPGMTEDVFSDVSASITPGSWTTVTGRSGSGKTTLISLLLRFIDPVSGKYTLNGGDALKLTATQLSSVFAWCPQESHVFDSTVRNNLAIARDRDNAPTDQEIRDVLVRVGLEELAEVDSRIGASGAYLSGGQRQRLAVARTLLAGAQVIILDEPTAHLDEQLATSLMDDLREILHDKAVVVVTHDHTLIRPSDRVIAVGELRR